MKDYNPLYNCPLEVTLELVGGKYKCLILWHLIDKTLRFSELSRLIPQATPKMMAAQLKELEKNGLITRTVYPEVPPKVEYKLSELGKTLMPILDVMCDWGAEYMEENNIMSKCCSGVKKPERFAD